MPKSMSVVREAIAGDEADDAMAERAVAEQVAAGRKVLPIVEGVVLVAALVAPLVLQDYLTVFATRVIILALFALSFDLVWGYAGIMSFGQALFFGSAGYGVALLARDLDITNIFLVLPAGTLIGLTFALLLGGFLLLGRHPSSVIFVSLGTLTGSYAADRLARGWYYLGGQNGIPSISSMTLGSYEFSEGPPFYYLVLGLLVVVYLLCRFLVRSQFGLALAGLRENEQRIAFFGYKAQHLKAIIFAIGGAIAGLAGSLYAYSEEYISPNTYNFELTILFLLAVIMGGRKTRSGALLGAMIVVMLPSFLADIALFRIATLGSDLTLFSVLAINSVVAPQIAGHYHRFEIQELELLISRVNRLMIRGIRPSISTANGARIRRISRRPIPTADCSRRPRATKPSWRISAKC